MSVADFFAPFWRLNPSRYPIASIRHIAQTNSSCTELQNPLLLNKKSQFFIYIFGNYTDAKPTGLLLCSLPKFISVVMAFDKASFASAFSNIKDRTSV